MTHMVFFHALAHIQTSCAYAHIMRITALIIFCTYTCACVHCPLWLQIHVHAHMLICMPKHSFLTYFFCLQLVSQDQRLWFSSSVLCLPSNNLSETVNQWTTFANGYYTVLHKYSDIKWQLKCFSGKCARHRSRTTETRTQSKRAFVNSDTCEFYVPVQYCTEHRLFLWGRMGDATSPTMVT